jgi:tripartite-type tricarboxylate transporter receptor subunit TctC
MRKLLLSAALLLTVAVVGVVPVAAQSAYPSRPVRIVVPQPPGGGFDFVARLLADRMGKQTGQAFIVENKPGSGTLVGTDFVAKAAPAEA